MINTAEFLQEQNLQQSPEAEKLINSNGYISVEKNKSIQNGSAYLQGMNENYQKAYIACMQRNRNEAGGTSVSDSDLKWYLPFLLIPA